ncbi:MAG TPA: hypothetical protein VH309_03175 [Elusimicrobiota bacterium]|nr:hypothetical protein [Elusimicrobiota bacterium]
MTLRLAALLLALAVPPARAGFFGRSKVVSRWTPVTVAVDGDDSSWDDAYAYEDDGMSVMAKNDGSDLYLLITGHTNETHDMLTGESHQDVTLWFVAADGKTRRWGALLPFSRRSPLTDSLRDPAGLDPDPEEVLSQGAAISTASLPGDVLDRLADVGRRPVWELKIPLKRVEAGKEGAVAVDLYVGAPPRGARRRPAAGAESGDRASKGGEDSAPGRGRRRGGRGGGGGESSPDAWVWGSSNFSLSVRLARDPSLPE